MSALDTLLNRNSHARLIEPGPDAEAVAKILQAALRAPDHGRLILAGLLHAVEHDTISRDEQAHAVAASLAAAQIAAESLGFGCIWRTGGYATDPLVVETLGGAPGDQVVGFLYLGTREGPSKLLPEVSLDTVVSHF
jgi:nitroreductase